jgi:hypothetical protein
MLLKSAFRVLCCESMIDQVGLQDVAVPGAWTATVNTDELASRASCMIRR